MFNNLRKFDAERPEHKQYDVPSPEDARLRALGFISTAEVVTAMFGAGRTYPIAVRAGQASRE